MSNSEPSQTDTAGEMTPDAAAVIARARRSFAFSIGLMMLGFIVVAIALFMRASGGDDASSDAYAAGVLVVPAGANIISAVPSEGMFAIAYEIDGKTKLRLVHGVTGAVIRDVDFVAE